MTLVEQISQEQANYDPHGFKAQGANSPHHSFEPQPYHFQPFPATVYKEVKDAKGVVEKQSKVVHDADELAAAKADGWAEAVGIVLSGTAKPAPASSGWKPAPPKGR